VKGSAFNNYSKGIRQGILLHRAIDSYTDTHEVVKEAVLSLKPKYLRYSGVIVDMFFDHFLSSLWHKFSDDTLEDFSKNFYISLLKHYYNLPVKSKMLLPFMICNNWFVAYGKIKGLEKRLIGMSQRTKFYSGMDKAIAELINDYDMYKEYFLSFFPDLINFAEQEKEMMRLKNDVS